MKSVKRVFGAACFSLVLVGPAQAQSVRFGIDTTTFDRSIRPQDDFFQFVNGAWMKRTPIPSDRGSYGSFDMLDERSEQAVHSIVDDISTHPQQPGNERRKISDFYLAFMDTARTDQLGIAPLRPELDRIAAINDRTSLSREFARLLQINVGPPIAFAVNQDAKQADRYAGYITQAGLGLPDREYYLRDDARFVDTRKAYTSYVEKILSLAGEKDAAATAARVVAFESKLAKLQWDRAKNRDRNLTYNKKTMAELKAMAPNIDWPAFFQATGAQSVEYVIVSQPDYLQAVDQLVAETPLPDWRAFLEVKLLSAYAPRLSAPFVDANFAMYGRTLQGLQENRARWKRAVTATEGAVGEALGRVYVEKYFTPETKRRMDSLVRNLISAFNQGIDQLEWMSPPTKLKAKEKLAHFNVKIGYPDRWRDYSELEVRPGDLVGNVIRSSEFNWNRRVRRLGGPVDRIEWNMTPQTVNAYYSSTMNEIVFPAAILQPPFFNVDADDAVNYGGVGAVIGHEISHGFDDQGRKSDGSGNLNDWWTPADATAFEQRANALVAEYNAFKPVPDVNVNGKLTLGENIGDLSGLTVAYKAYKLSLNGKEAPVINGLTGDQRFFLGFAQIWREMQRDDALRQQLLSDPHSPGQYRANGVLVNMPEFYAAWNVKPGDKMYLAPEKRVKIW